MSWILLRVAHVLVCDPSEDTSALLELVVRRLGHEPVPYAPEVPLDGVAAAVVEPAGRDGLELAHRLRALDVPVVFVSIYAPQPAVLELDPAAYLVKPFPLHALERALEAAFSAPPEPVAIAV